MKAASGNHEEDKEKIALFDINGEDIPFKKPFLPNGEKTSHRQSPLSPSKLYCVQVASFKKKADADRLRSRLRKKNYKAFVDLANLGKKGIWYRVRVGRFGRKKTAEELAKVLLKREKLKGLVLKR
jgi:cell division septation protein DedD